MVEKNSISPRGTDGHAGWLVLCSLLLVTAAAAQDAVPVAQPATDSPPVAQPVNPPVAQPATSANPVASGTDATTSGLVVTTPAAARFDSGMVSFNAGQWVDAATAFSGFVRDFPQDRHREEALYRLAESYRNLGRADDALAAYTFQVKNYPDGPFVINATLRQGAIFFDQGKYVDAMAPLQTVSDKGQGELQQAAKYLLGRALLAMQKEPEGRAMLQDLVDQQPPGKFAGGAAQTLAERDDSQNNPKDALGLWQKALALTADPAAQATIAARGGWSALTANQPGDAEKLFQKARQLDSSGDARKVANTGLLRTYFSQKKFSDWVTLYTAEKDKLLDSAHAEISYDLAHAQFSIKHWPEAVAAFDQYLKEFGTDPSAVNAAYERFLAVTQVDRTQTVAEGDAYLKAWPQSAHRAKVQLLQAHELSHEAKYADALSLWESLAAEPVAPGWPHGQILLERARAYDELQNWAKAAASYQSYLDDAASHPGEKPRQQLAAQARLALSLQNSNQLLAATEAWKTLQSQAPAGSSEQQVALESLGLIYAHGGPGQEPQMAETFRLLLDKYPQTKLRALAAFSVGNSLFKARDYAGTEPYLLNARSWDATAWMQPATQRLALGAYGLKNADKAVAYLKDYDALPPLADPQAAAAARLPAAFFYWLGETARKAGQLANAETFYSRVTQHTDPGDLLAGAWWQLGEVQAAQKKWAAAVASYQKYQELKPDSKSATVVLLALGRAQLGAQKLDDAKATGQQALLQEPEGPNSAAARMLLGEIAFTTPNYPEAARMFATLGVLFDDPRITPQALARAGDAFEKAGNASAAAEQRAKLKEKYSQYVETSYL